MAERQSHALFEPITVDGAERRTIDLRRLKGKDLRDIDKFEGGNADKTLFIIQRLSGWPPEAVEELDAADIEACGKIIEGFTKRKPSIVR